MLLTGTPLKTFQELTSDAPLTRVYFHTPISRGEDIVRTLTGRDCPKRNEKTAIHDVAFHHQAIVSVSGDPAETILILQAQPEKTLAFHTSLARQKPFTIEKRHRKATARSWQRRLTFIMGVALCALVPGSKIRMYVYPNAAIPSCICTFTHEEVRAAMTDLPVQTSDMLADFKRLIHTLWFHYPEDLTGDDAVIKMLSLMMVS